MKKISSKHKFFFIIIIFLASLEIKSQTHEFAPIGAEWYYEYQKPFIKGYVHITVNHDTIIKDVKCRKLTKVLYGFDYYEGLCKRLIGYEYVTQSNDSVMIYRDGAFCMLFDFGASVGDTWTLIGNNIPCEQSYGLAHVVGIGADTISGQVLKYVKIINDQYSYWGYGDCMVGEPCRDTVKIFERIGPIKEYLLPEQHCLFDYGEGGLLRCYIDDDIGCLHFSWTGINVNCDYINDDYQSTDDINHGCQSVIYPNPCHDFIHIILDGINDVYLYDNQGTTVFQLKNIVGNSLDIDMSDCPKGLYLLKNTNDTKVSTHKIIKK